VWHKNKVACVDNVGLQMVLYIKHKLLCLHLHMLKSWNGKERIGDAILRRCYIILNNSSLIATACITIKMMELFSYANVQSFQATQCLRTLAEEDILVFFS
jgi:hypothetical protein